MSMNRIIKYYFLNTKRCLTPILFSLIFIFLLSVDAYSQKNELYLDPEIKVNLNNDTYVTFKMDFRFKECNNYYRKSFVGISKRLSPLVDFGVFYNLKQSKSDGWNSKSIIFPQLIVSKNFYHINLFFRQRLEYHLTDNYIRYRLMSKFIFPLSAFCSPWIGDELRYFFHEQMIGENEVFVGILFKINKIFKINLFYDHRSIYTKQPIEYANILRMSFKFNI